MPGPDSSSQHQILTLPNLMSLARLLAVPAFLWILFARGDRYQAALLLAFLGATDWVDGYVARRFNQVSELGKILDPLADRILLGVGVLAILIDGSVPAWIGWLTVGREVLVSIAALVLATMGARRIDVTWWGKAGTFGLMFAFPLFLASNPDGGAPWHEIARVLAWITVVPGILFSWYAAVLYVPLARRALAEGRTSRMSPVTTEADAE